MRDIDFTPLIFFGIVVGVVLCGVAVGLFFLARWIFNHLQWVP